MYDLNYQNFTKLECLMARREVMGHTEAGLRAPYVA